MSPAETDRLWTALETLRARVERLTWVIIALSVLSAGGSAEAVIKALGGL